MFCREGWTGCSLEHWTPCMFHSYINLHLIPVILPCMVIYSGIKYSLLCNKISYVPLECKIVDHWPSTVSAEGEDDGEEEEEQRENNDLWREWFRHWHCPWPHDLSHRRHGNCCCKGKQQVREVERKRESLWVHTCFRVCLGEIKALAHLLKGVFSLCIVVIDGVSLYFYGYVIKEKLTKQSIAHICALRGLIYLLIER